jgi:glycosyltransferase involved in cell wall biosynthesis
MAASPDTRARILGVAGGDPWDRATSSGRAAHTFGALQRAGRLAGAIGARPGWVAPLEQAGAFARDRERWKQRFYASATRTTPLARAISELTGSVRARRPLRSDANVVLQVTGWFSLARAAHRAGALHALYLDTLLPLYLRRPDLALDPGERGVRGTLAFERRLMREADVVFAMSEWTRQAAIEDLGADPQKVVVVGIGAIGERSPAMPERDWSAPRVLFVGRAWERKGGPELLTAFRRLHDAHPEAELTIVGPAPREAEPGVIWTGEIDRRTPDGGHQLAELHERATIFCMPSRYEPFGNASVEAMSWGLPVVATRAGGVVDLVEDGVCGRLVAPGDAAALADALLDVAADPVRARAMGEAAVRRVLAGDFTWDGVASRIVRELDARLAQPR